MSDLFDTHPEVQKEPCDQYAKQLVGGPVRALDWQGHHSYTLESSDQKTVIQFRSGQSPLDSNVVELARIIHGRLVPKTMFLGYVPGSVVSIWKMEKIPGVGFLHMVHDDRIKEKLRTTVDDLAKSVDSFFIQRSYQLSAGIADVQVLRGIVEDTTISQPGPTDLRLRRM